MKKVILGIVLLVVCFLLFYPGKYWDGKSRLAFAGLEGEDVLVSVYEPKNKVLTKILVPGDTEVQVARGLGTWRLKSVRELGNNEKIGGRLVSETLTKTFAFPIEAWVEDLSLKDRIIVKFFELVLQKNDQILTDLRDTSVLAKTKLNDGEEGFKVSGDVPAKIMAVFGDEAVSKEEVQVSLVYYQDSKSASAVSERVGVVIQNLGAKVVSSRPSKEKMEEDCLLVGANSITRRKIATLFSCKEENGHGDMDIEFWLGPAFLSRF